jgi:hypothetical protein
MQIFRCVAHMLDTCCTLVWVYHYMMCDARSLRANAVVGSLSSSDVCCIGTLANACSVAECGDHEISQPNCQWSLESGVCQFFRVLELGMIAVALNVLVHPEVVPVNDMEVNV